MTNISHPRSINGIDHEDTHPQVVTVHAVPTPEDEDYIAYTALGIKFEEEVPMGVRELIDDPRVTTNEIASEFNQYTPSKIVLRHFIAPEHTDSGDPEPHRTYAIELYPPAIEEYRDGIQSIVMYLQ